MFAVANAAGLWRVEQLYDAAHYISIGLFNLQPDWFRWARRSSFVAPARYCPLVAVQFHGRLKRTRLIDGLFNYVTHRRATRIIIFYQLRRPETRAGTNRASSTQSIDAWPTILSHFGACYGGSHSIHLACEIITIE